MSGYPLKPFLIIGGKDPHHFGREEEEEEEEDNCSKLTTRD